MVIFIDMTCLGVCRGSIESPYVPNAGFLEDVVFEDPSLFAYVSDQHNGIDSREVGESSEVMDTSSELKPVYTRTDNGNDIAEQIVADVGEMKLTEKVSADESNLEDQYTLSTEDVDGLLDKCLLQALHTTVKEKDLPMPGSTLWYDRVKHSSRSLCIMFTSKIIMLLFDDQWISFLFLTAVQVKPCITL